MNIKINGTLIINENINIEDADDIIKKLDVIINESNIKIKELFQTQNSSHIEITTTSII